MNEKHEYYPIIDTLQRCAGGGVTKLIKMSFIFDENGGLMVKGEPEVIKLWPKSGVKKLIDGLTE